MSSEEKRAWIMAVVPAIAYAAYVTYLLAILGQAQHSALTDVPYVRALLWTIGGSILASIVLHIAATIGSPEEAGQKDQRDRDIHRFGDLVGQSFVILGGVVALGMSLARLDHFWIANVLVLGFFLSAELGAVAKVVAYRRGFHPW